MTQMTQMPDTTDDTDVTDITDDIGTYTDADTVHTYQTQKHKQLFQRKTYENKCDLCVICLIPAAS